MEREERRGEGREERREEITVLGVGRPRGKKRGNHCLRCEGSLKGNVERERVRVERLWGGDANEGER